nr:hypothetical protein CFP56_00631 [Quercus suber]
MGRTELRSVSLMMVRSATSRDDVSCFQYIDHDTRSDSGAVVHSRRLPISTCHCDATRRRRRCSFNRSRIPGQRLMQAVASCAWGRRLIDVNMLRGKSGSDQRIYHELRIVTMRPTRRPTSMIKTSRL